MCDSSKILIMADEIMANENQILTSRTRKSDTIFRLLVNASYMFFMFLMNIYCYGLATAVEHAFVSQPK